MATSAKSYVGRCRGTSPALCLVTIITATFGVLGAQVNPPDHILSGCEVDYPPFCLVQEDGRADGFSVELMREALEKMGRTVEFRTGTWAEVRSRLERGDIHALPLVGRTPEREAAFDFTVPYLTLHGVIVVRQNMSGIYSLDDLRGKRVGVMRGDNAEEFLRRKDCGAALITTPTFSDAFRLLATNGCDAVVVQNLVARRIIQESRLKNLKILNQPIPGFSQQFCFAVRDGDHATLAMLNEGLSQALADGTLRRLHARWFASMQLPSERALIIGGDRSYPPFEFLDEQGRPCGFDVDLTKAIARQVGMDVRIQLGNWSDTVRALHEGEIDAVQGMFYSQDRARLLDFSPRYMVVNCVSVMRRGSGVLPKTFDALAGLDLVVEAGDDMLKQLRAHGVQANVTTVATQEEVLREVAEGRHLCGLIPRPCALYFIHKHGWSNLEISKNAFYSADYAYAVGKGQEALLASFSEGLSAVKASGEYQKIYDRWFSAYEPEPIGWLNALKYVAYVAAPLLLVALLALVWSWNLRRQVAARTADLRHVVDALAESEKKHRLLSEQSINMIWTLNTDLIFTYANPATERLTGYPPDAVIGTHLSKHFDEAHLAELMTIIAQETAKGPNSSGVFLESRTLHRDGSIVPIEIQGRVIFDEAGHPVLLQGTMLDLSERKRTASRIEHLNRVLRAIRDVNHLITHESICDRLLQQACSLLVSTRGYLSAWVAVGDADGIPRFVTECGVGAEAFSALRHALQTGDWPRCCGLARETPDGIAAIRDTRTLCHACPLSMTYANTSALVGLLRHGDREFGILAVALPVDLAEDAEEFALFRELVGDVAYALFSIENAQQRREEEAKFRSYVENAPYGIFIADAGMRFTDVNPAACELTGYPREELLTLGIPDILPPGEDAGRLHFQRLIAEGRSIGEISMVRKDNEHRCWRISAVTLGKGRFLGFVEDITDQKQRAAEHESLQAQLLQMQKLDSVGRLAGGVAHDFNNLLMGIMGYTELCRDIVTDNPPALEMLDAVLKEVKRSANLTRQLLAFARKQIVAPKVINLNDAVPNMLTMLRRLIGEDIDVVWFPAADVSPIKIDPGQIDQILANLCVNARDAINGTGHITIETAHASIADDYCKQHAETLPGNYAVLAVSDDGCGMDQETLSHIFEPFYTKKNVGEGTGLGLATVYGIVKQNNGFINVYSEPGKGTTFRVYLPVSPDALETLPAPDPGTENIGGAETILLVEDEHAIREPTRHFLERLGYTVLSAESPEAALRLVAEQTKPIDLLVTDVVMPGMNGRELSDRLRAEHAALRCLYLSGYTANVIAHRGVLEENVHFLSKPCSLKELAHTIRKILDQPA